MYNDNSVKYEVVISEYDGWDYQFPVTEPERISNLDSIARDNKRIVNSNYDWRDVRIPDAIFSGGYRWMPTDDFILHMNPCNMPKDDMTRYVGRFSYNPATKEFIPSKLSSSHASSIHTFGSSIYNKYIRGIYLRELSVILIRPYYDPLDEKGNFDSHRHYNPDLDTEKTWDTINMLAKNGLKKNMKIITKANNHLIKEMEGIFI